MRIASFPSRVLPRALIAGALAAVAAASVAPASAQAGYYGRAPDFRGDYNDPCVNARKNNQAAGMIVGGILGGVLGSNVAARGHRDDGTALGAVVGAIAGSEVGRGNTRCATQHGYGAPPPSPYGYEAYPTAGYPSAPYPSPYPSPAYDPYDDDDVSFGRYGRDVPYLAGGPDGSYTGRYRNDDYATRECADAKQITRLPDGTEIHRPVEACRDAYYGDWKVRD